MLPGQTYTATTVRRSSPRPSTTGGGKPIECLEPSVLHNTSQVGRQTTFSCTRCDGISSTVMCHHCHDCLLKLHSFSCIFYLFTLRSCSYTFPLTGLVVFLEEDHYVAEDFLHILSLMLAQKQKYKVDILSLGTYLKKTAVKTNSKQVRNIDNLIIKPDRSIVTNALIGLNGPTRTNWFSTLE